MDDHDPRDAAQLSCVNFNTAKQTRAPGHPQTSVHNRQHIILKSVGLLRKMCLLRCGFANSLQGLSETFPTQMRAERRADLAAKFQSPLSHFNHNCCVDELHSNCPNLRDSLTQLYRALTMVKDPLTFPYFLARRAPNLLNSLHTGIHNHNQKTRRSTKSKNR